MATAEIDKLFVQALTGDYEDEAPWEAIHKLRWLGTREVFERAAELCKSNNSLFRARGASVLAQLGVTIDNKHTFPGESYLVVTELVQRETESQPLAAGIAALGHLGNPSAIPLIAKFSAHKSSEVRFDVAFALGCYPNIPLSIETLIQLMQDPDKDVRDWSTFGLGVQGDADSEEIRDALFSRLSDSDADVREEAMVGLGKRRDKRVLSALLSELEKSEMTDRIVEAAHLMLGMSADKTDWEAIDYAVALRNRFSL
jgi:HEAT repeat protein